MANIYVEAELDEVSTTKDFLVVRQEDKRQVDRKLKYYNLDAIISVRYRIRTLSQVAKSRFSGFIQSTRAKTQLCSGI